MPQVECLTSEETVIYDINQGDMFLPGEISRNRIVWFLLMKVDRSHCHSQREFPINGCLLSMGVSTCDVISKADGGERNEAVVDAVDDVPVLEAAEDGRRDDEHHE